jgi:hypothetical protein
MSVTIEDIVTVNAAVAGNTVTITFPGAERTDVLVVVQYLTGGASVGIEGESHGWQNLGYGGATAAWWRQLIMDEGETFTFTTTDAATIQMIGVRMRSDYAVGASGTEAFIDEAGGWGEPRVTDFPADPVLLWDGSDSGTGDFTATFPYVTLATLPNVALHRHDPLEVPLGTTLRVDGTEALFNQQLAVVAFGYWAAAGVVPPVAAVGGWGVWIVD